MQARETRREKEREEKQEGKELGMFFCVLSLHFVCLLLAENLVYSRVDIFVVAFMA
jgi:hypothetical protein